MFDSPNLAEWQAQTFANLRSVAAPFTVSIGLIALIALVLRGLVPAYVRDRLVHWRWNFPLPGARAFTEIGPADPRVSMKALSKRYRLLPTDPAAQSAKFYEIYSQYRNAVGVLDAHKSYLAARDIALITALLMPVLPTMYFLISHAIGTSVYYAAALFVAFVVISRAAQIYGARLVENTLAVASAGVTRSRRP